MAEYAGSAQALSWINSAGTLDLSPHTRQFNLSPDQATINATAGSDANQQYLPSFVDYSLSWQGVAQDGVAGTALAQQLKAGVTGTLVWGPSGTITGAVKYTIPAFSLGLATDAPYADVVTLAANFMVSSGGAITIGAY